MKKLATLGTALMLLLVACTSDDPGTTPTTDPNPVPTTSAGPVGLFASALIEIDSCDALLDRIIMEALERVGPYGFDGGPVVILEELQVVESDSSTATSAGPDFSTTNIQELGVDEPDIVKTDGRRILAVNNRGLHYIDLESPEPVLASTLPLPEGWGQEMLLAGDRVLIIMTTYDEEDRYENPVTPTILLVDISDGSNMRLVQTLTVENQSGGSEYVAARLVGDRATLVFTNLPNRLPGLVYPASDDPLSLQRAEEINRQTVRESTLEDWFPSYNLSGPAGEDSGLWVDCQSSYMPQEFSGLGMVGLFTVDMTGDFDPGRVTTLVSEAGTVYASQQNLYLATQRWVPWFALDEESFRQESETITTHIHKFDITTPGGATYEASGSVDGFLYSQFAMSEQEGFLRVASTNRPPWAGDDRVSESRVDVLEQQDNRLQVVGSVDGLGRDEQIFAVRFLGDIGYVVTFRQTDPLYTIDLSDPANPRTTGELKILGYSAYLHPIGDGLLLGVGQDADEQGVVSGLQVSLFDVSDLDNPRRIAQYTIEDAYSPVEFDHRAFLWWAPNNLAVLPVTQSAFELDEEGLLESRPRDRALVLRVGSDTIDFVGEISHLPTEEVDLGDSATSSESFFDYNFQISRSLVVGDTLFTYSSGLLAGNDLNTLEPLTQVSLAN